MGLSSICFTAIAFCVASIVVRSCGELLVLRRHRGSIRELTCTSEDDDSALIWNDAIESEQKIVEDFLPRKPKPNNVIDCAVWNSTKCRIHWKNTSEWEVVESAIKPMGPVFDFRWEGFEECTSDQGINFSKYQYLGKVSQSSGNAMFSVRGKQDVHVLLCGHEDQTKGPCLWIIIGGWEGKETVIRYCADGAPPDTQPPANIKCSEIERKQFENTYILDSNEWRTFGLTWSSDEKMIRLFKDTGHEGDTILQGQVERWPNVSHMSVRLDKSSRARFHFYEYLLTEKDGSALYTEEFDPSDEEFCVELLVGLCPKCKLNVSLVDKNGHKFEIGNIAGDEKSVDNGMLTWRSRKLSKNIKIDDRELGKSLRLEIRAILTGGEGKGRWAMDNFRMCKPAGQRRESTISLPSIQPDVRCQKLSHNGGTVVDPWSSVKIASNTIESRKFIDKLVESCGPSCKSFGENSLLCDSIGCTCNRGYEGSDCDKICTLDYHGYNCDEICEPCPTGFCDRTTGLCATSCQSNTLLPPHCKTEIKKPTVMYITDTTAVVFQTVVLEADVNASVDVVMQVKAFESCIPVILNFTAKLRDPGTPFYYKSHASNLNLDTIYTVHAIVSIKLADKTISATSPETNFTTTCFMQPDFTITPGKNELEVVSNIDRECVNSKSPDYLVRVFRLRNNKLVQEQVHASFPAPYKELMPYTKYKVIISDQRTEKVLLAEEVRTLESAPSKVRNLEARLTTENETTLQWEPPLKRNGLIRNYSISLTGKLIACVRSGIGDNQQIVIRQTVNETTLKIPGLHPYAKYAAKVIAYTSESGKPETVTFRTLETDIPRSKFSNFSLGKNKRIFYWDQPLDCTTITGSTKTAALVFESIDNPAEEHIRKQTQRSQFNVNQFNSISYAMYRVRLYVIRGFDKPFNSTSYQELTWRSPATAPPRVKELEVYEADIDTNTISLEWLPPSPANGEIESYEVSLRQGGIPISTKNFKVSEGGLKCECREGYVCLKEFRIPEDTTMNTYDIMVYAVNKGIGQPGNQTFYTITPQIYKEDPSEPKNLTSTSQSHGIMMLNWSRQAFSFTKITKFYINVRQVSTKLKTNRTNEISMMVVRPAQPNQTEYSAELFLSPSTVYNVTIVAVNQRNVTSRESVTEITVPGSVAFASQVKPQVTQEGTLINLEVPGVVNATVNTVVHVTVNGSAMCSRIDSPTAASSIKLTKWVAAVYEPGENETKNLTIGANYTHGVPLNCSLSIGETYAIKLVAMDRYTGTSTEPMTASISLIDDDRSQQRDLGWLASPPILAVCLVLVLIGYRNCERVWRRRREPIYVEPDSVSSTTISKDPRPPTYLELIPLSLTATSTNVPTNLHLRESSISERVKVKNESSDDLYSLPNEFDSCSISMEYFEEYVKDAAASGLLHSQFMLLRKDLTRPCEYGSLPENMLKNRYRYQIAYDHSRVVLEKIPGDLYSDYINASYIKGYRKDRAYIAAQRPKPNTVNDFWRMVWQKEVRVICMLTYVTKDAETEWGQYWPDVGDRVVQGDFHISNSDEQVFANYTLRIFELSYEQNTRKVTHLQYTEWPLLGVPTYPQSLVGYLKKLRQTRAKDGRVLVHCSTGDDRTGTLILCDICLSQAIAEKEIDVTAVITRMRDNRANMVGTLQQYVLAHIIIVESIVSWFTQIPTTDVLSTSIKRLKRQLPRDIQSRQKEVRPSVSELGVLTDTLVSREVVDLIDTLRLNDSKWQEQALKFPATWNLPTAQKEANVDILGLKPGRPEVIYDDVLDRDRIQINVVSVDGFRVKNQYLVCSLPSSSTLTSFWGSIAERQIKLIIILQCSNTRYPTCIDIMSDESIVVPMLDIQVVNGTSLADGEFFTNEQLLLNDTSQDKARSQSVTVLKCKGWGCDKNAKPPPPATLVSLWRASEKIPRKKGETLVLCHDGITGCGLYLALSFLLERMVDEKECDVIAAVQAVRRSEPEFVQSMEQFQYLYDAAVNYVESL